MLILLLLIIFAVLFLVFVEEYLGKYKWFAYILIGIFLILYAGLRPVGFDRDSENYENYFMHPDSRINEISVEPSFLILSRLLYPFFPDVHILFFLYALLGVGLLFFAIKRITNPLFLPILIYVCNFFLLHDVTQIRAGVISGLFLLSIKPLSEGKRLHALCYIMIGAIFHFSALALLPLLFLSNTPISRKWKIAWAMVVPVCFLLYFSGFDLLTTFHIPYISDKIDIYQRLSETKLEKESILNPFPLIKMAVFLYLLYFSETIKPYVPSIYLLIKILACSVLFYFAFTSIKIVSMRISELYGIIEIVLYPCIIYTIRPINFGKLAVCIIAFIEIYFQLIQWEILNFSI